jgi:hypothetical protein
VVERRIAKPSCPLLRRGIGLGQAQGAGMMRGFGSIESQWSTSATAPSKIRSAGVVSFTATLSLVKVAKTA